MEKYDLYCTLPIRLSKMRIQRGDRSDLEETFVPATMIYIKPKGFLDENYIDRDALTYAIANTRKPFPYGHVYAGSGHICLGNIFVPSKVPRYSPQQPLETLFLHNDRNVHHGESSLTIGAEALEKIDDILKRNGVGLEKETREAVKKGINLVATDGLWLLGADVYRKMSFQEGKRIMTKIYEILFPERIERKEGDEEEW